jgi:hypothetical protein
VTAPPLSLSREAAAQTKIEPPEGASQGFLEISRSELQLGRSPGGDHIPGRLKGASEDAPVVAAQTLYATASRERDSA